MSTSTPALDALGLPAILRPFRPKFAGWVIWPPFDTSSWRVQPYVLERWYNPSHEVQVASAIERVDPEDGQPARLEYHLSISGVRKGARGCHRISAGTARWALKQFGFDGSLEDNHVPGGKVRNYWRPVDDKLVGQICACVDDEPAIREMQGDYVWRGHQGGRDGR